MIGLARTARWTAIAIAAAAVLDPAAPLPTRSRPAVRVVGGPTDVTATVIRQLHDAGFAVNSQENEAATVLVGDAPSHSAPSTQYSALWVLDTSPRPPNVRVLDAISPAVRLPEQSLDVRVTLEARGLAGKSSELVLEDSGIVVASASHVWKNDNEAWQPVLRYLPPGTTGGRLRVRSLEIAGETSADDNTADVPMPPLRGPIRTLVVEAGVTWPAMFVRRSVEGEPAFAVAAFQRASTRIATRAGAPPAALTRQALAPFETALVGAPDNLTRADVDALRWFVEQRGGVAVLIPDRGSRGPGGYLDLLDGLVLEPRVLATPAPLGPPAGPAGAAPASKARATMRASELLVARRTPAGSRTLAATNAGETVVFSARRGAGAVIFSGALDAWRYRAQDEEAFARFWRGAIAEEAAAVPPVLEVSVEPSLVAAGASARVRARLALDIPEASADLPAASADTPVASAVTPVASAFSRKDPSFHLDAVTARAVSPGARVDVPIRLWPTAEAGVYQGEWRPSAIGDYNIAVTAGASRGDAAAIVAAGVSRGSTADPEGLALIARSSGGTVFPADRSAALVDAMKTAFPARASARTGHPMRSPWWVVPFAGLLCVEWALCRRRGQP